MRAGITDALITLIACIGIIALIMLIGHLIYKIEERYNERHKK